MIEFRADAQNVFNHKSLSTPGGLNLGSAAGVGEPYTSANSISSVTTGGRLMQLMFRVSF
jgi:hypothetical protein